MKLEIKSIEGAVLYSAECGTILELLNLAVKDSAYLGGANLRGANLGGANLGGANLGGGTVLETGETWSVYLTEVLPALLAAGGRAIAEVVTPKIWNCHSWDNCPMAEAFKTHDIKGVPVLLRPRAEQFIRYFDAKLIPLEAVGKKVAA